MHIFTFEECLVLLIYIYAIVLSSPLMAAILDDQTVWGHNECLALTLTREQINGIIEVPAKARVEVDIFELQQDSHSQTLLGPLQASASHAQNPWCPFCF
ncbi:hypothetical protein FD754_001941 [Muntiacus muntjak]|uniref:Uncharacterized protein n=1 Tax=Muntiacus muntjak TaxID=9888 RepID=A0A5N3WAR8_MUNMU|nr:hypothetical protein FD754_001941 [Muntiacus muntjak]